MRGGANALDVLARLRTAWLGLTTPKKQKHQKTAECPSASQGWACSRRGRTLRSACRPVGRGTGKNQRAQISTKIEDLSGGAGPGQTSRNAIHAGPGCPSTSANTRRRETRFESTNLKPGITYALSEFGLACGGARRLGIDAELRYNRRTAPDP